ncbi:unnamed protein product [Hymenolepis diminuta]|uniref:Uncharacterized protein n=1 Tax=Hymenolepis diminuta TaxID=6216 RepID=A0A564YKU1_HYMDI|nr:unnamed protein product [Hymenolepis diminuta]
MLSSTHPVLQATCNHLFNCHASLYAIWTPINQDLKMVESLDLNCKQPSKITNSATEFDTELFQTDIRGLSQEFSEHADDSNLIRDDSYDFLPEHAAASGKSRGKRKRKTPKSTAVNQQKPSQSVTQHGSCKYQLLLQQREQTTRINPTETIPINMPTSSRPQSPSTKFQTINHKLQHSVLPKATLTRKCDTRNLLAVINKSKSSVEQKPKEETTDA